ncbi:hypothetical protein H072_9175 [Dactylellina haptotyla CBS 200.50]|uniref:Uncharacterized protein n=1 Tax=Dactylellina haptotyla (strain CBS 200.50) TaxID=1284197 RepID=S8BDA0_DACHA|nr:hypothetical protein H072_9175 [Dactylellina haptotyla CBS 200.50]
MVAQRQTTTFKREPTWLRYYAPPSFADDRSEHHHHEQNNRTNTHNAAAHSGQHPTRIDRDNILADIPIPPQNLQSESDRGAGKRDALRPSSLYKYHRLRDKLDLPHPPDRPPAPIPPKLYKTLFKQFSDNLVVAPTTKTPTGTPSKRTRGTTDPATAGSSANTPSKASSALRHKSSLAKLIPAASGNKAVDEILGPYTPLIQELCADTPAAVEHVTAGMGYIFTSARYKNLTETPYTTLGCVYVVVVKEILGEQEFANLKKKEVIRWYEEKIKDVYTLLKGKGVIKEKEDPWRKSFDEILAEVAGDDMRETRWFLELPKSGDKDASEDEEVEQEEDEADEEGEGGVEKGKGKRKAAEAGMESGIGSMMQDRVDFLSDKRRKAFSEWKADALRRIAQLEADLIFTEQPGAPESFIQDYRLYFSEIERFRNISSLDFTYKSIDAINHSLFEAMFAKIGTCLFRSHIKKLNFHAKNAGRNVSEKLSDADREYLGMEDGWSLQNGTKLLDFSPNEARINVDRFTFDAPFRGWGGSYAYALTRPAAQTLKVLHLKVEELTCLISKYPVIYSNLVELDIRIVKWDAENLKDIADRVPNVKKFSIYDPWGSKSWRESWEYRKNDIIGMKALEELTLPWPTQEDYWDEYVPERRLEAFIRGWMNFGLDNLKEVAFGCSQSDGFDSIISLPKGSVAAWVVSNDINGRQSLVKLPLEKRISYSDW